MFISEFLANCRTSFKMTDDPKVLRQRDTFTMDHALVFKMNRKKINMINKVRIYL